MAICGEDAEDRGRNGSYLGGLIFGIAWWIFIDAVVFSHHEELEIPINFVKWLPGIGGTLGFFGLNAMDWGAISADSMTYHGDNVACKARSFALFCVAMAIGGMIGGIVILAEVYVDNEHDESIWPGVAIMLQSVLLCIGTFVMKGLTAE